VLVAWGAKAPELAPKISAADGLGKEPHGKVIVVRSFDVLPVIDPQEAWVSTVREVETYFDHTWLI